MHSPLTSVFGRRLLCLWGQFVGTCSALAYAWVRWRGRERPARCGFATEMRVGGSGAWAFLVLAYAVASTQSGSGFGRADLDFGQGDEWQVDRLGDTPVAIVSTVWAIVRLNELLDSIVVRWYLASLDRAIAVLGSTDPTTLTWTVSSTGDQHAGWWCRRLAVEVAMHRWDIEHASVGDGDPAPGLIDRAVAGAGIEEFIVEFLPGLVAQEGVEGIGGTLCLQATDGPEDWWIDLDCGGQACAEHKQADTTVGGTRSDLLLWLTNRGPLPTIQVLGDQMVTRAWHQLRR
jgi:hypothetical protein